MKLDFTKADGIVEVTETCPACKGEGSYRAATDEALLPCATCEGRGKLVVFMTPKAIREMIGEEGDLCE